MSRAAKHGADQPTMREGKIRVLVVDDHPVIREGLRRLLEEQPDFEVVGEAEDGAMALERTHTLRPDVEVMDVNMPRMTGIAATRQITSTFPDVKVIGFSMHNEESVVSAMRQAGAMAHVSKDEASEALCDTIRHCMKAA